MINWKDAIFIVTIVILILSFRILYLNVIEYIKIYDAIMNINVSIHDINVKFYNKSSLIRITLFINNPSQLNIKISGLIGHLTLNDAYLGLIDFYASEMVVGANSYNVSVTGEIKIYVYRLGILLSANKTGIWNWKVYGWILIEIYGEQLPISYEGVYIG